MLKESIGQKLDNAKSISADSASAYQDFCKDNRLILNAIPSGFHSNDIVNIKMPIDLNVVYAEYLN